MFFVGHMLVTRSILALVVLSGLLAAQQPSKITGTYTSMYFNEEGGDLLGQELKIVLTRRGYQGALQFAEGGPGGLIIVDVHINGNKISFTIPETAPEAGRFSGTLTNGVIRGIFSFKEGGEEKVELRRGKSYWD